ncbi:MAG: amylo-alpha-1,6-glucosidase [Chloroflexi bacterium]|nr:amylo-alpha-1,6-glucosidase [Chloroflexota bacterium]
MVDWEHAAHVLRESDQISASERERRKQRILTQGEPSVTRSIADAVVIKDREVFFLAQPDGNVPTADGHGFGLYYHDCRYLNGSTLKLADADLDVLVSAETSSSEAVFQLSNPDIQTEDGTLIPKESLGITWTRVLDGEHLTLHDTLRFQNYGLGPADLPVSLTLQAGFEDIFAIRGLLPQHSGRLHPPQWQQQVLVLRYDGADGLKRSLTAHFSLAPDGTEGGTAHFRIRLGPGEHCEVLVSLVVAESQAADDTKAQPPRTQQGTRRDRARREHTDDHWLTECTQVASDSLLLDQVIQQSLQDLAALRSSSGGYEFVAAGVPWFATLFGRDSLITALQCLAFQPALAEETLRLLAHYQGDRVDARRDEQPGKILHELRVGELARLGEIPHTPYYGTVDATLLFLILLGRHADWTGSLQLFHELGENAERALAWMDRYGDVSGRGYIEYQSTSERGLINQGWKDSGNAIVNDDGSLATPPIALVEVQGYAYDAKMTMAGLCQRAAEPERAARLRHEAQELRARIERDFWVEEKGYFALALQRDGRPAAVVASNPGHLLWSGAVSDALARRTAERLMAPDMYSGWGVRTLSDREQRFNPVGYHLGTVWPHDNSIIAAGFRRYGYDDEARRIFGGTIEAAMHSRPYRLPELFAGFGRGEFGVPVRYPVACHPQAWASGAFPYLLTTMLGLMPDASERRLRLVRPILPDFVDRIELRGLRVGDARTDLRLERSSTGVALRVLKVEGELDVIVET